MLFVAVVQEDAANARKVELKAKSQQELKELLSRQGLETGSKEQMINTLLSYETKCRDDLKAFEAKVEEVATQKEEELDKKTNAVLEEAANARKIELKSKSQQELKELLSRQGLETGSKEQMIATLLAHEAKCREDLKVFEAKVEEVATQKE